VVRGGLYGEVTEGEGREDSYKVSRGISRCEEKK
jgi:hypothetical protein